MGKGGKYTVLHGTGCRVLDPPPFFPILLSFLSLVLRVLPPFRSTPGSKNFNKLQAEEEWGETGRRTRMKGKEDQATRKGKAGVKRRLRRKIQTFFPLASSSSRRRWRRSNTKKSPHFFIACESHFSFPLPPPPSPRHFSSFLCREHRKKRAERVSFSLENKAHLFKMALRWSFVHSFT